MAARGRSSTSAATSTPAPTTRRTIGTRSTNPSRSRTAGARPDQARQLRAARHVQSEVEVIGQAVSQGELDAFRRGIAQGQRSWEGLTLPWDADLRGAQLAAFDLSRATMRGAKLDRAVLSEAKLVEANLRKASLRGAVL